MDDRVKHRDSDRTHLISYASKESIKDLASSSRRWAVLVPLWLSSRRLALNSLLAGWLQLRLGSGFAFWAVPIVYHLRRQYCVEHKSSDKASKNELIVDFL